MNNQHITEGFPFKKSSETLCNLHCCYLQIELIIFIVI